MKTYKKIDGVIVLNKPLGISSNRALQRAKGILGAQKAGHTGSLDPLATGVLPICLGEATKFSRFLLDADKSYLVKAKLGVTTSTGDMEGEVLSYMPVPAIYNMQEIMDGFLGLSSQIPSMYSAIKHNGQPLYKLARKNIEVERKSREIYIHEFTLLNFSGDEITCSVKCSKGTYIRTLIEDLGEMIGCGAHVTSLFRIQAGRFDISSAASLDDLREGNYKLLPLDTLLSDLPSVQLDAADSEWMRNGRRVVTPPQVVAGSEVRMLNHDGALLGVGEALNDGSLAPKRLVSVD